MAITLETLLQEALMRGASDLHLIHGSPPYYRIAGNLAPASAAAFDSGTIMSLVAPYLTQEQRKNFETEQRANASFTIASLGRFRMNLCQAQGTVSASVRVIPTKIYALEALGLPPIVETLTAERQGIIFITGPTGSGKSTTMAAMLEHINQRRAGKVITIEDPIETLFQPKKCLFVQREVGVDVPSYEIGITEALRQDPDILSIGEMRSVDSIRSALTAAETGHLVFATLHTPDSAKTAQRILSAAAGEDQSVILDQLCNALTAVISQELVPRADGNGRLLIAEVLLANPAVRRSIRERKLEQIYDLLQTGGSQGMVSKDSCIKAALQKGLITRETALAHIHNAELLTVSAQPAYAAPAATSPLAWTPFGK